MDSSVAIVIPSRNVDYLLDNCIEKIRQLYPYVKIVLVLDDVSPEDYKRYDDKVLILQSEKYTMSAKRNQGVAVVDTKYVAFIDSDAFPDKNWLEISIDYLEKNSKYAAITGCQMNYPDDSFFQKCLRLLRFSPLFSHEEWFKVVDTETEETDCSEFMTSNVILRRETYLKLNGMKDDIYLAEDNEFSSRMCRNGYKIRFNPKVRVYHREATTYPFLRKFYTMAFYYTNCFVNGVQVKSIKQTLAQFLPLLGLILYFALVGLDFYVFKTDFLDYFIYILPLVILLLLIYNAVIIVRKLAKHRLIAVIYIVYVSILFCFLWVLGTLFGLFPKKLYDVKNGYKHY